MSSSSESSDPTVSPEQRKETDIVSPGPKSTSNVLGRDAANSFAYRTSVSDIPGKITTTATETINSVKKTVVDDTLPAAADALNNAQARVSTLISRDNGPDDTTQGQLLVEVWCSYLVY